MKIQKVNDQFVLTDVPIEEHRRGKNYAAIITGKSVKYGLERKFLSRAVLSNSRGYVFPEKPVAGQYIEVMAIYYSGSGYATVRPGSGYFRIEKEGTLSEVTKESVMSSFEKIEDKIEL